MWITRIPSFIHQSFVKHLKKLCTKQIVTWKRGNKIWSKHFVTVLISVTMTSKSCIQVYKIISSSKAPQFKQSKAQYCTVLSWSWHWIQDLLWVVIDNISVILAASLLSNCITRSLSLKHWLVIEQCDWYQDWKLFYSFCLCVEKRNWKECPYWLPSWDLEHLMKNISVYNLKILRGKFCYSVFTIMFQLNPTNLSLDSLLYTLYIHITCKTFFIWFLVVYHLLLFVCVFFCLSLHGNKKRLPTCMELSNIRSPRKHVYNITYIYISYIPYFNYCYA